LLEFVAQSLSEKLCKRTTVVFDATQAPSGLPHESQFAGMKVLFSRRGQEADELIEELIDAERAPRELLVVSSDHRVQRAARQRGAGYTDSEDWMRQLAHIQPAAHGVDPSDEPTPQSAEITNWLAEFSDVDSRQLAPEEPAVPLLPAVSPPLPNQPRQNPKQATSPNDGKPLPGSLNPFPPGYGEDLLEDADEAP
jgi:predicted RNA-binding protein with PIN domain